jgi:hypothetical protein
MNRLRALVVLVPAIFWMGCSYTSLDGLRMPAAPSEAVFFVRNHGADERQLDSAIADALQRHGLNATAEETETYDYLVTYIDRWQWDMRNYLIDLRIDVRDAKSNVLVGTARSYQTSLSAMGETHEEIIEEVVRVLLQGPPVASQSDPRRHPVAQKSIAGGATDG